MNIDRKLIREIAKIKILESIDFKEVDKLMDAGNDLINNLNYVTWNVNGDAEASLEKRLNELTDSINMTYSALQKVIEILKNNDPINRDS